MSLSSSLPEYKNVFTMVGKLPEPAVRSVLTRLQRAPSCAAESLSRSWWKNGVGAACWRSHRKRCTQGRRFYCMNVKCSFTCGIENPSEDGHSAVKYSLFLPATIHKLNDKSWSIGALDCLVTRHLMLKEVKRCQIGNSSEMVFLWSISFRCDEKG